VYFVQKQVKNVNACDIRPQKTVAIIERQPLLSFSFYVTLTVVVFVVAAFISPTLKLTGTVKLCVCDVEPFETDIEQYVIDTLEPLLNVATDWH
jgi:hypothetical protein